MKSEVITAHSTYHVTTSYGRTYLRLTTAQVARIWAWRRPLPR